MALGTRMLVIRKAQAGGGKSSLGLCGDTSRSLPVFLKRSLLATRSLRAGPRELIVGLQPSPHVFDFRRPNRRLNSHWLAEAIGN